MKSVISKNFSEKNICSRVCQAIGIGFTSGILIGLVSLLGGCSTAGVFV